MQKQALLCALALLFPSPLRSEVHRVQAKVYYRTFFRGHPVLQRVRPGDTVVTKTIDSFGQDEKGVLRHPEPGNPLTGPFYVEGAEPGDALAVRFTKVQLNRDWGYTAYRLGLFSLTPEYVESIYPNRYKENLVHKGRANTIPWDIDLGRKMVRLREPFSNRIKMEFPARPMLGCVGVAPAGDFAPTSAPSGSYGGNLDYNEIGEAATVILPVYHPGALLFIGDGHALQGDGEPTGTGVETSLDVEFAVEVRKKANVNSPRVETPDYIISVGSQPEFASSIDNAIKMATTDMVRWLVNEYQLEPWAAHLLIGYQARYDVVTVMGSAAVKIPRKYLPQR